MSLPYNYVYLIHFSQAHYTVSHFIQLSYSVDMGERGLPIMSYAAYMNAPTAGFDTTDDILLYADDILYIIIQYYIILYYILLHYILLLLSYYYCFQ